MNVKELKKLLEKEKDETEIVMSSDAEGNSFSRLDEVTKENGQRLELRHSTGGQPKGKVLCLWPD